MRCWGRLQQWAEDERTAAAFYIRLSQAAVWFAQGKAGLWRNPELDLARRWRARNHPTAAWARRYDDRFDAAIAFLERSEQEHAKEEADRERARKVALRRAQGAAAVLATFLVVALSLAYLTWRERQRAEQNLEFARTAVDESLASAEYDPGAGLEGPEVQELRRELLGKAEKFYRAFMQQERGSEAIRRDVAVSHFRLGHINRLLDRRDDAIREYREAITQLTALSAARPDTADYRATLANAYNWVGELLRTDSARYGEAAAAYDSAFGLQQTLVKDHAGDVQLRRELARTMYNRGILRSDRPENAAAAEADFVQAIGLLEPIAASDPFIGKELARTYNNLGALHAYNNRPFADVRPWWEKAIATSERLVAAHPDNRGFKLELAMYCANLASSLQDNGEDDAAMSRSRQAVSLLDDVAQPPVLVAVAHGDAHSVYGALLAVRDADAAERELVTALTLFADGARNAALRATPDFHQRFGDLLINLAAFSAKPSGVDRGRLLLARGVSVYAALAAGTASSGSPSEARAVLETVNRVLPSMPERERAPLAEAQRLLQRKVGVQ